MKQQGEGKVWICNSYLDSSIVKRMTFSPEGGKCQISSSRGEDLQQKYRNGEKFTVDELPSEAHGLYSDFRIRNLPDFFNISQFFIVSQAFADVLNGFELGDTDLVQVKLCQHGGKHEIEGPWYFLNIGCRKQAFLPEESVCGVNFHAEWAEPGYAVHVVVEDNQVAVSSAAFEGCDLWFDPSLRRAFFISGPLEAALKAAKLTRTLRRHRCIVVD